LAALSELLSSLGHVVKPVLNGAEALASYRPG
jgi:CheY-like chemotaxis protein